jgi:hypothetical protein
MRPMCTQSRSRLTLLAALAPALWLAPALHGASSADEGAAAQFCPDIHFYAYSTADPGGQKLAESLAWDGQQQAYVIRGPQLARMLDYPGVGQIPSGMPSAQALFKLAIRPRPSSPVDRFCEERFQESAECTAHGEILYTQLYTDCDLQTYRHVVRISNERAGTLLLLVLSFADVRGQFSQPLYLAAGSDLRLATMPSSK